MIKEMIMINTISCCFSVELPAATSATSDELQQHNIYDSNSDSLDMTAVSIVGLICLVIFTLLLIIITIIVVRMRNKDGRLKQDKVLEEYRRVPLIPEGANNICCDSGNSSSKSCSCYTRSVLIIKDTKHNVKDFQCAQP